MLDFGVFESFGFPEKYGQIRNDLQYMQMEKAPNASAN